MKLVVRSASFASVLTIILVFASLSFAQMAGGYSAVAKDDAGGVGAANFAVSARSKKTRSSIKLSEIAKAERQVVQGSNYRLCMAVSTDGGKDAYVQAVVYVDLKGKRSLTKWASSNCGEMSDGFEKVENSHAGIQLAASFAVDQHSKDTKIEHKLVGVLKGEVKGMFEMTYRICMKVNEDEETHVIEAVVSMDQYSNMKLVSWKHSDCGN